MSSTSAAWTRGAAALATVAGVWVATASRPVTVTAQGGITITAPGVNSVFAAGPDFATEVLGDPWDFSNQEDIAIDPAQKTGWSSLTVNNGGNGLLSGVTTATAGANVAFLQRPWYQINNPGRTGHTFPIDSTKYTKLAIKMTSPLTDQFPRLYWFQQEIGEPGDTAGTRYIEENNLPSPPGTNIFVIDMTLFTPAGVPNWNAAPVKGFSLYPNSSNVTNNVSVDWVRLTAADTRPEASKMTIAWTGGTGTVNATVSEGSTGTTFTIATGLAGSGGSLQWNYGVLPPGSYTLRVGTASRAFTVNGPPIVKVTDPDETGGEDFATTVLGNPWDMADANDYFVNVNIVDHLISRQVGTPLGFTGISDGVTVGFTSGGVPTGDPQVYFLSKQKPTDGPVIDSTKYHRLTFGLQVDHPFNLTTGSVARVFWGSASSATGGGTPYQVTATKDIIAWPGLNYYTLDLATLTVANGGLEPTNAIVWNAQSIRHFRIDPCEFAEQVQFHYPSVKLAADDATINGAFTIKWAGADPENDPTTIALYYDTDQNAANGMTLITSGLPLGSGQYVWNTTAVTPGTYWIYAVANDGHSSLGRYATGPLKVIAYTPPTNPVTSVDNPVNGASLHLPFAVSGFAIDTGAPGGTGVDSVTVYADRGTASEVLLGSATYGGPRPDAGAYGAQFTNSAFNFGVRVLSPGTHTISVLAHSTVSGASNAVVRTVTVLPLVGRADFDGDARADMGVYSANGDWTIRTSASNYVSSLFKSWGGGGYVPVPGDYDGDGRNDFAVYREATGDWSILKSSSNYTAALSFNWGGPGYKPVVGDYDGDGKTDLGLYVPTTGQWTILKSSSGFASAFSLTYGGAGYAPVGGHDFDGDGKSDIGVYNQQNGAWSILKSSASFSASINVNWGCGGCRLVPGDYDGDGRADFAVYQRTSGVWSVLKSNMEYSTSFTKTWGGGSLIPVPGDYDGDLAFDMATFDRTTGTWSVLRSSSNYTTSFSVGGFGGPTDQALTLSIAVSGDDSLRPSDFDGDARSDITIYQASSAFWYTLKSSTGYAATMNTSWGGAGYTPVPGDYDGDGKADVAIYQQSSGNWYILLSSTGFTTTITKNAGGPGWTAVPGDYDGDGKTDLVVYNTTSGLWYGLKSSTSYMSVISISWGGTGYTAAPGDFDGDGRVDLATYQQSSGNWYVLLSGANYTASMTKNAGGAGYVPVQGDYDGDAKADFIVYNTTSGLWFGLKSSTNYTTTFSIGWGGTGYTPVRGDFDGDGKLDLALYQGSTGAWSILLSGSNYTATISKSWGGTGYAPVPAFP